MKKKYIVFSLVLLVIWAAFTGSVGWDSTGYNFNGVVSFIVTVQCLCLWGGVTLVILNKLKPLSPRWTSFTVGMGIVLLLPAILIFLAIFFGLIS